jgi:hypothetical protein
MCAEAGFPDVLAHYKAVLKGMSHDGKAKPALCYDHAHGKTPAFILRLHASKVEEKNTDTPTTESQTPSQETCGCGRPASHRGRCAFRRGAKPAQPSQAIERATPSLTVRTRRANREPSLSLVEVLTNLQAMLEQHQRDIESDINAVRRVVTLVEGAQRAESAAEFLNKGA